LRVTAALLCGVVAMALAAMPVPASADGGAVFSLRPANPVPGKPETATYFVYSVQPGDSFSDEAIAVNSGTASVHLRVYPADGITAGNGGIAFPGYGEARKGPGNWVEVAVSDLTLKPGEERRIAFRISVPPGVQPGHHVAGILLENADLVMGTGGVAVNILQRTATAVIDLPPLPVPLVKLVPTTSWFQVPVADNEVSCAA